MQRPDGSLFMGTKKEFEETLAKANFDVSSNGDLTPCSSSMEEEEELKEENISS